MTHYRRYRGRACLLAWLFTMGCGGDENPNGSSPETNDTGNDTGSTSSGDDTIVGTWQRNGEVDSETIEFREDGTVVFTDEWDGEVTVEEGTWSVDGNLLTVSWRYSGEEDMDGVVATVTGEETESVSFFIVDDVLYLWVIIRERGSGEALDGTWVTVEREGGVYAIDGEVMEEGDYTWTLSITVDGARYTAVSEDVGWEVEQGERYEQDDTTEGNGTIREEGLAVYVVQEVEADIPIAIEPVAPGEEPDPQAGDLLGYRLIPDAIVLGRESEAEAIESGYHRI